MSYNPYSSNPRANELLYEYADFPREFSEEFRTRMIQVINDMCISINSKESGWYSDESTITGEKVLPTYSKNLEGSQSVYYRTVRRKLIYTGALPNNGTKQIAHNIQFPKKSVGWRIWGCASIIDGDENLRAFFQMPLGSPNQSSNVELYATENHVVIVTGTDRTNFNFSFVVVEYAVAPDTERA